MFSHQARNWWSRLVTFVQAVSRTAELALLPWCAPGTFTAPTDYQVESDADNKQRQPSPLSARSRIFEHGDGTLLILRPVLRGAADNETAKFRLYELRPMLAEGSRVVQYTRLLLLEFTATACTRVGVANGHVVTTDRFCDAITIDSDRTLSPTGARVLAPRDSSGALLSADNQPVGVAIDGLGSPLYELESGPLSGGGAATHTTCAAIWL